jgi:uncharacterized membrane protein YhaH (DUF805 family)
VRNKGGIGARGCLPAAVAPAGLADYDGAGNPPRLNPEEEKNMNFGQAISTCLGKYVDFSGRAGRPEFWWFFLFQILVSIVASFLGGTISSLVSLALLAPALAVGARRLHDIGKSGWWQLIAFTVIGVLVLIYWFVQPSAEGSNAHDKAPAAT